MIKCDVCISGWGKKVNKYAKMIEMCVGKGLREKRLDDNHKKNHVLLVFLAKICGILL